MYGPLVCRFGVLARFIQIQTDTDAPEHGSACYRVPVGLVITPATWVRVPTRLRADILITFFARIELWVQRSVWSVTAIFADARLGHGRGRNGSWLSHSSVHSAPAGAVEVDTLGSPLIREL